MPYCTLTTTARLSVEAKKEVNEELLKIVETIPGKSRSWIMTRVEDEQFMSFAGSTEPCAMISLKCFGNVSDAKADDLTARFCSRVAPKIGVDPSRVYVTYEGISQWGWNGGNF